MGRHAVCGQSGRVSPARNLYVLRLISFSRALWSDLINPHLVLSFFTIVAGTDVFGIGINLRGFATIALLMWLFAR